MIEALASDDRLARRAAKGDRRALEAIYRRYHQDLYRFCLAMVGRPQDAQDALQNTMVKVLRALPGEERHIALKPWLYRIARNEAVETVRRRREGAELDPERAGVTVPLSETAEERERLRALIDDLAELPDRQRAALTMRELAGMGFEEIGEAFETSPAVARQTLYEARLSLRQMEAGREMTCEGVQRQLSDADGRVSRRREIVAHLRACEDCRAFREAIDARRTDLASIAPLPVALSAALLQGAFGAAGASAAAGAGGGGLGGTIAAVATSTVVKSAATLAVVGAVGVAAADRGGLIDAPVLGGTPTEQASSAAGAGDDELSGRRHGKRDERGRKARRAAARRRARAGRAAAGERARGGVHDRRRGKPEGLPPTADKGQQTAGARRPPQAKPPPGETRSGSRGGPRSQPTTPPPPASPPPRHEEAPATSQPQPQPSPQPQPQRSPQPQPEPESESPATPPAANGTGPSSRETEMSRPLAP